MTFIRNILSIKISSKNRIYYLDILRGLFILLVLYHHASAPLSKYVLQFHMPALFILSGYTEYLLNKRKPFLSYVKAKFSRLIVPYFLFEILNLLLFVGREYIKGRLDLSFTSAIVDIIICLNNSYQGLYGRLWFLPAIFLCSLFSYVIRYYICKEKPLWVGICCLGMFLLSYAVSTYIPFRLPFTLDIALLGTSFFLLGYLSGRVIRQFFEKKCICLDLSLAMVFTVLFVLCNNYSEPKCFMYTNTYHDFPFMVVCAVSGTALVGIITKLILPVLEKVSIFSRFILWYSINSLTVFPVHLLVKVFATPLLVYAGLKHWATLLLIIFFSTIPAVNFINVYLPFMLGSFKKE